MIYDVGRYAKPIICISTPFHFLNSFCFLFLYGGVLSSIGPWFSPFHTPFICILLFEWQCSSFNYGWSLFFFFFTFLKKKVVMCYFLPICHWTMSTVRTLIAHIGWKEHEIFSWCQNNIPFELHASHWFVTLPPIFRPWSKHIPWLLMTPSVHISMKSINSKISVLKTRRASRNCSGRSSTTGHSTTITGAASSPFA